MSHIPQIQSAPPAAKAARELIRLADILRDCGRLVSKSGDAERCLRDAAALLAAPAAATQPAGHTDTERLDWVFRQADEFSSYVIGDAPGDGDFAVHGMGHAYGQGRTAREALDAARTAQEGDGKPAKRGM